MIQDNRGYYNTWHQRDDSLKEKQKIRLHQNKGVCCWKDPVAD